jgi:hypothetical protein
MSDPTPFAVWLREQGDGATHHDLTLALATATAAAIETGKVAEISLKLTVKPINGRQVLVSDVIKTKIPEADRQASFFFWDEDAMAITRRDPQQIDLPLTIVPAPRVRDLPDASA